MTRKFGPYSLTAAWLLGREGYAYRAALYLSDPDHCRVIDQVGTSEGVLLADGERYAAERSVDAWLDGEES